MKFKWKSTRKLLIFWFVHFHCQWHWQILWRKMVEKERIVEQSLRYNSLKTINTEISSKSNAGILNALPEKHKGRYRVNEEKKKTNNITGNICATLTVFNVFNRLSIKSLLFGIYDIYIWKSIQRVFIIAKHNGTIALIAALCDGKKILTLIHFGVCALCA